MKMLIVMKSYFKGRCFKDNLGNEILIWKKVHNIQNPIKIFFLQNFRYLTVKCIFKMFWRVRVVKHTASLEWAQLLSCIHVSPTDSSTKIEWFFFSKCEILKDKFCISEMNFIMYFEIIWKMVFSHSSKISYLKNFS